MYREESYVTINKIATVIQSFMLHFATWYFSMGWPLIIKTTIGCTVQ